MNALLSLCGGFLVAVLWFDLMFDVQVIGAPPGDLPEAVLASIAGYYARVTTAAAPMGYLVGVVMLIALGGTLRQLLSGEVPRRLAWAALLACGLPVALALARVLPNAVRLGERSLPASLESELARSICYEHLLCLGGMLIFCALQLRLGFDRERSLG
jgi:hypothetical protein